MPYAIHLAISISQSCSDHDRVSKAFADVFRLDAIVHWVANRLARTASRSLKERCMSQAGTSKLKQNYLKRLIQ